MYQFVPRTKYQQYIDGLLAANLLQPSAIASSEIKRFERFMTSAAHYTAAGQIDQALVYCPSHFLPRRYAGVLKSEQISHALCVDLLRGGVDILRIAAVQAWCKRLPLILTDLTMYAEILRFFEAHAGEAAKESPKQQAGEHAQNGIEEQFDEPVEENAGECDVFLPAPQPELLAGDVTIGPVIQLRTAKSGETSIQYAVICGEQLHQLLSITLENSFCGPVLDNQGRQFELLQLNLESEYRAIAGLMSKALMTDSAWLTVQPDTVLLENLIFDMCYCAAADTAKRGMNYLLVSSQNEFHAVAGILASPPGYSGGYWGNELKIAVAMLKGKLSPLDAQLLSALSKFHASNCGEKANHVDIGWLGCADGARGTGLGSQLFRIANNIADQCQAYEYMWTSGESNLEFYRKQGLQTLQEMKVSRGKQCESTVFAMLRSIGGPKTAGVDRDDKKEWPVVCEFKHGCGV